MSVPAVIGDAEPQLFKFWDAEDVINPFLFDPTLNVNKASLLVGGIDFCIAVSKYPAVTFSKGYKQFFILHMVVHRPVFQVDPGGVWFFLLIGILVHQHRDSVI